MSYKRSRTNSYGDYNQVSQSQSSGYMLGSNSKSSKKFPTKKYTKKITKADIDRAISRRLENKIYVDYQANQTIAPASTTVTPTSRYLLPRITQGLTQSTRIGNSIHIRNAYLTIFINCQRRSDNMIDSPLMVRVWLVSSKIINDNAAPS